MGNQFKRERYFTSCSSCRCNFPWVISIFFYEAAIMVFILPYIFQHYYYYYFMCFSFLCNCLVFLRFTLHASFQFDNNFHILSRSTRRQDLPGCETAATFFGSSQKTKKESTSSYSLICFVFNARISFPHGQRSTPDDRRDLSLITPFWAHDRKGVEG